MKSNSYARTTRRNAKEGEHERGTREGGGGKNREEKTREKETRRKRLRKRDGGEVYSSDRRSLGSRCFENDDRRQRDDGAASDTR